MADQTIAVTEGSGRLIDTERITVGVNSVDRQRIQIAGVGATDVLTFPAHDAVDTGPPLKVGGYASLAAPTAVATADRVNAWLNLQGQVGVFTTTEVATVFSAATSGGRLTTTTTVVNNTAITAGTPLSLVAAQASLRCYLVKILVSSSAASGTRLLLQDGSGGTTIWASFTIANQPILDKAPTGFFLCRTTANTALAIDSSANTNLCTTLSYVMAP